MKIEKMTDFKLKLILSALGGIVFAFILILLTFTLPVKEEKTQYVSKPKGRLETISHSMKNK
jgi:hypothetical protein